MRQHFTEETKRLIRERYPMCTTREEKQRLAIDAGLIGIQTRHEVSILPGTTDEEIQEILGTNECIVSRRIISCDDNHGQLSLDGLEKENTEEIQTALVNMSRLYNMFSHLSKP